jgi:hypothetical protein
MPAIATGATTRFCALFLSYLLLLATPHAIRPVRMTSGGTPLPFFLAVASRIGTTKRPTPGSPGNAARADTEDLKREPVPASLGTG